MLSLTWGAHSLPHASSFSWDDALYVWWGIAVIEDEGFHLPGPFFVIHTDSPRFADGAERIAQDIQDIVQTRVAMAEKLGAIEQHVSTTIHHASTTMTQLAEKTTSSVRATIQATQEAP